MAGGASWTRAGREKARRRSRGVVVVGSIMRQPQLPNGRARRRSQVRRAAPARIAAVSVAPEPLQRPELALVAEPVRRRLLVVVNPCATTVSDRLRSLIVHALGARYEVTAVDTQRRGHAIELARDAAAEGFDAVLALGGDGTVNEAANGLA